MQWRGNGGRCQGAEETASAKLPKTLLHPLMGKHQWEEENPVACKTAKESQKNGHVVLAQEGKQSLSLLQVSMRRKWSTIVLIQHQQPDK